MQKNKDLRLAGSPPEQAVPIAAQMAGPQAAPPNAVDVLHRQMQERQQGIEQLNRPTAPAGVVNGFKALAQVIGRQQVLEAQQILNRYKEGKRNLEQKVIENEQWYKLRHWEYMRKQKEGQQVEPVSAWLFNSLANKHADAMDNFPSPNFLPREEGDKEEAERLSAVVPVILDQDDFEETYDGEADDKLKEGTGIYGVFWDDTKHNGLGDVTIVQVDILSLFWEPGVTDIQKSRHFFSVELTDNDILEDMYPHLRGKLTTASDDLSKYIYDDTVDTNNKSAVVDWYYKKRKAPRR